MGTTNRIFNFAAGPAVLPLPVLEEAQRDLVALPGLGMSVLEISHRSKTFEAIIQECEANIRKLAGIPEGYHVIFLQGGATMQFSMVPLNLLAPGQMYSDRVNELDLRIGKNLRFGRTRLNAAVDLLNALNLSTIIIPNQAFIPGGAWLAPTGTQTPVMTARTAKLTLQYDF